MQVIRGSHALKLINFRRDLKFKADQAGPEIQSFYGSKTPMLSRKLSITFQDFLFFEHYGQLGKAFLLKKDYLLKVKHQPLNIYFMKIFLILFIFILPLSSFSQ